MRFITRFLSRTMYQAMYQALGRQRSLGHFLLMNSSWLNNPEDTESHGLFYKVLKGWLVFIVGKI